VLDRPNIDYVSSKIQPQQNHSPPKKRRGQFLGGYYVPALKAVTAARGYLAGQFPTLDLAAISCGSSKDSVAAAVAILKSEDPNLLTAVLGGRKPLLGTARSVQHAAALIDSFQRASSFELQTFGRVITPEKIFAEAVLPAL
jgi:hypothetical protein